MKDLCLKYILTGGPSCGKTAVLNKLKEKSFLTFEEQARVVIKQSLSEKSTALPWQDAFAFSEKVISNMVYNYDQYRSKNEIAFTDRSMIDLNAYLRDGDLAENQSYYAKAKEYHFAKTVFFFPIWEEIFNQDNERIEDFKKAVSITNTLRDTYLKQGYILIEMPFVSIDERVEYMLNYINANPHV